MSNPVVIAATARHTATLIFFHGLGDTGHGWASSMGAVRSSHIKVVCPTAPTMPVTLNAGFRMPSWFDLRSLDPSGPEDEEGLRRAADSVHSMIASEIAAGIPSNRIVIGGFSQGGALALFSALTYPEPLAGVIALSAWLPLHQKFPGEAKGNKSTPVLQCHGDCDPIVPYKWGQATATLLKQFMTQTEFKTYRGVMHSSCDEVIFMFLVLCVYFATANVIKSAAENVADEKVVDNNNVLDEEGNFSDGDVNPNPKARWFWPVIIPRPVLLPPHWIIVG